MFRRALFVALTGSALSGAPAIAFEDIDAERPFLGMSSRALEQGLYQLEQGAWYEGGTLSFPSLHRFGLGSEAELLISTPLMLLAPGQGRMGDLSVGGKWRFLGGGEHAAMGLVALAAIGAEGQLAPRASLVLDLPLPGALLLTSNLGASLAADAAPRLHYSAALACGLLEGLKLCTEIVGEHAPGSSGQRIGLDAGLGWLVEPSTQVDLLLYKGVTPQAPEWSGSIGVSKRWGM